MNRDKHSYISSVLVTCLFLTFFLAPTALQAQEKATPRARAYVVAQETTIRGTILNFTEDSATPPIGAQLTLQTGSGALRVHVGNASFLRANHVTFAAGEIVTVTGVNVPLREGSIFAARVIQKGNQSLALRSPTGAPLWFAGVRPQGGVKSLGQGGPR
ncbi:MAG: hypothetical protein ABSF92_03240 [Candidatus Acidiferrales bacterium]|jgi:DNA/RNA endonuclease YhcR with UshA esterase domain